MQLVRSEVDALALPFDARAVFVDVLQRVDFRSLWYITTLTDYSAFLGIPRRRLGAAVDVLTARGLLEASFPRGHDGALSVPVDIYERCVRTRVIRAPLALDTRGSRADERERPGAEHSQTSDVHEDQKSDPAFRFQEIRDLWSSATRKDVTDDDLARCLTYCRSECVELGADYKLIIDETIGRVAEQVGRDPHRIKSLTGYMRDAVKTNAAERLAS